MLSTHELELTASALSLTFMAKTPGSSNFTSTSNPTPYTSAQMLHQKVRFLTLEKKCIKVWDYQQGSVELYKKINIK